MTAWSPINLSELVKAITLGVYLKFASLTNTSNLWLGVKAAILEVQAPRSTAQMLWCDYILIIIYTFKIALKITKEHKDTKMYGTSSKSPNPKIDDLRTLIDRWESFIDIY